MMRRRPQKAMLAKPSPAATAPATYSAPQIQTRNESAPLAWAKSLRLASDPLNETRHTLRSNFDLVEGGCKAAAQISFTAGTERRSGNAGHLFLFEKLYREFF